MSELCVKCAVLVALVALVVSSCADRAGRPVAAQARLPAAKPLFDIRYANDIVSYDGMLVPEGLEALKRDDAGVHTLMIRSDGGDVEVGMDFGEWVLARRLAVVVKDYCLSACANYVFVAGRAKAILEGAVVAWHGSPRDADADAQIELAVRRIAKSKAEEPSLRASAYAFRDRLVARQDAFFAKIGVSECITRIGRVRFGASGFFFMSVKDMARFGVDAVVVGRQREEYIPRDLRADLDLVFVAIDGDLDPRTACDEPTPRR